MNASGANRNIPKDTYEYILFIHLHLEVLVDGKYADPLAALNKMRDE